MELDETTKNAQDTSSVNAGQSSGSKSGTTSKGKVTITKEEHQKLLSDASSEQGRAKKLSALELERDALKTDLQSATSRLDALERDVNESRLAEVRGDPAQLQIYQREQNITKRERASETREQDLARREAQVKADADEVAKDKGVVSIAVTVAAKHGLETAELEELGISDPEVLEKVAVKLAAGKTKTGDEGGEGGEGGEEGEGEFEPDSGEGAGGGAGTLTPDSVEKMSMPALEKAIDKAEEKTT